MKKAVSFAVVICLALLLSACQIYKNFLVVNASDELITVEYSVKESSLPPHESLFLPKKTTLANLNTLRFFQKDWEAMTAEEYNFDENAKTFRFKIAPSTVVVIATEELSNIDQKGEKNFDLEKLKISGINKEIYFENSGKLFSEFKRNDFEITYK